VAFAAAGFGFAVTTEDVPFGRAGSSHPVLGSAHAAIQALAIVASVAVIAGALPLIAAALKHARRERKVRLAVSLPAVAVAGFATFTAVVGWLVHSHHLAGHAAFVAWIIAGLGCSAVCVVASRIALFSIPVARRWLLAAFAWGTVATAAMLAIAGATALYTIALSTDVPTLASASNGPLAVPGVGASLAIQLIVMIVAGAMAATSTRRGWRAIGAATTSDEGNACQ
jgi:hypothetical protein